MVFASDVLTLVPIGIRDKIMSEIKLFMSQRSNIEKFPLHYSVLSGHYSRIKKLLDNGFDINAKDSTGRTPLMLAIKTNHKHALSILLEAGADLFILDNDNRSALEIFSTEPSLMIINHMKFFDELKKRCHTNEEIIKKITDAGCNLYQAVFLKNAKVIEYLIEHGLSISSIHPVGKQTALHAAVMLEDVESVKVLLKHGVDCNAVDIMDFNALAYLYQLNPERNAEQLEILKLLLDAGASATSLNRLKGTFQIACTLVEGDFDVIHTVMQYNIDFRAKDKKNQNLLHYLVRNRNPRIAEVLEMHVDKLKINGMDIHNRHPLHTGLMFGTTGSMIKFLLDHGARINDTDITGVPPICYPCYKYEIDEDENILSLQHLLHHNADVQFISKKKHSTHKTIFDGALKKHHFNRLQNVLAHIAVLEGLGIPITNYIRNKINSNNKLKKYFHRYQEALKIKIYRSVTILKLLTDNRNKMAQYSSNTKLVLKLESISYKRNVKYFFLFYYNTLKMRLAQGIERKKLQDRAASGICKIFKGHPITEQHYIVSQIIKYINDDSDLGQLCKV